MVAAVSVAAVLGTQRDEPAAAPTKQEAAWVAGWGKWRRALSRETAAAQELVLGDRDEFLASLEPLKGCSGFRRLVPAAPDRFRAAREASEDVCAEVKRLPRLGRRLVDGDATASADFSLVYGQADLLMFQVEDALQASLSYSRRLPVRTRGAPSRIDPRIGSAATELAGRKVEARCWSPRDWDVVVPELHAFYGEPVDRGLSGFAEHAGTGGAKIHLAPWVCVPIRYAAGYGDRDLSFAVEVVAHEAEHILSPVSSEAVTECHALQAVVRTAVLLGLSEQRGRELANRYWHYWYLRNPESYRTTDCSEGGPLDETAGDGIWP